MTTNNKTQYEKFAQEIKRLCQVEKQLFQEVLQLPHVFESTTAAKSQSKTYFEEGIKNIENEIQKLEKMEVVIAVVGTMKAGKSTTINAIVGTEVLPNRNAPMTTLPTLIRNVHGQTEPVLILKELEPLKKLSKDVAEKLSSLDIEKLQLHGEPDGKELIELLLKNKQYPFQAKYNGQQNIFSFLKHLNDLMRLAKEELIKIEPSYSAYENLDNLPVIEIEFFHLKGQEHNSQGSLAILDTPGPNEFGQSNELKQVFKKQLEKASAVALVIDYTQMKSEAEATVRKEVDNVFEQLTKESLYVLVNKFDQLNSNSMEKGEVQKYVSETLMDKKIESNQVYPISAQNAYLANRAKHNLELHGKLPEFEKESWVNDFAQKAAGEAWKYICNNVDAVKGCTNDVWDKSLFEEPLKGMVEKAHSTAAENCVKSAMPKLVHWHQELTNTCSIFNTSIVSEIAKISDAIKVLENSINDVETVKKNVDDIIKDGIISLEGVLNKVRNTTQDRIKEQIDYFFKEGKKNKNSEEAKNNKIEIENKISDLESQLSTLKWNTKMDGDRKRQISKVESQLIESKEALGLLEDKKAQAELSKIEVFPSDSSVISFQEYEKDKANELLKKIEKEIADIVNTLTTNFSKEINDIASNISKSMVLSINQETKVLLETAKNKLGEFQLYFSLPELKLSFNFDTLDLIFGGLTTNTKDIKSSYVSGRFNAFLNFFNDDWGRTKFTYQKTTHDIDVNKIREMIFTKLEQYENNHTNKFTEYLEQDVKKNVENHINELSSYLERYRDLFLSSEKANAEMEQEEKKQVIEQIELLMNKNKVQSNDIKVIENGLGVSS
jgi:predicted GTPase